MPKRVEGHSTEPRSRWRASTSRMRDLDGGYAVCFETHTADADLAALFRGLPDDRAQLPRWGYVIEGKVGFRFADREETYEAGDAYYVGPGHTPVHYAGAEIVEFSPTEILGETIPVVLGNLDASGIAVECASRRGRGEAGDDRRGPGSGVGDTRRSLAARRASACSPGFRSSERRLDAGGVSTALLEGGAGPPLVLLHGGIECGGAYWAPVIARLVENHRVVVPDAPGLGESEPVARLDDETFARWLRELIRLTCEARPTLVAHSLFGTLAARFAAAHGDSLSRSDRLRRARRRPLPDAARASDRRDRLRAAAERANAERVRALRAPRPRADPPARSGVVRRVQRLRAVARARPARQADDEPADQGRDEARPRRRASNGSRSRQRSSGGATTG